MTTQKWKFQGQEHDDHTGWDQFKWRNHQPELGRFFNIDPLAEKYAFWTPYAFSGNMVTSYQELEGLEPVIPQNNANRNLFFGTENQYNAAINIQNSNWTPFNLNDIKDIARTVSNLSGYGISTIYLQSHGSPGKLSLGQGLYENNGDTLMTPNITASDINEYVDFRSMSKSDQEAYLWTDMGVIMDLRNPLLLRLLKVLGMEFQMEVH